MLDSRKKGFNEKTITIIGQGTSVGGELKSKGSIRIEGVVSGRVHSDDTISIQDTGRVKADMIAAQIEISGEVEGNVFAHDILKIYDKGKLIGDITAPKISIAEGVIFEGKCTMKSPGQIKALNAPDDPLAEQMPKPLPVPENKNQI